MVELWLNLKASAPLIVEQSRKYGRRIEVWIAEKIDCPVHPHQGNRAHIADHTVILNWLEAHVSSVSLTLDEQTTACGSASDRKPRGINFLKPKPFVGGVARGISLIGVTASGRG